MHIRLPPVLWLEVLLERHAADCWCGLSNSYPAGGVPMISDLWNLKLAEGIKNS
jgi:hypothetical protein